MSDNIIVPRAKELLQKGLDIINERDAMYNRNGVDFAEYRLNGMESTWEEILENFLRLWNSKAEDKAVDWVVYAALQAAYVEAGCPQSKFSPIFNRFVPEIYKAMKADDEATRDEPHDDLETRLARLGVLGPEKEEEKVE